jgi:Fur family ferric uptake transcriptional regulator
MMYEPGGASKPYSPDGPRALLKGAGLRVTAVRLDVYSYLLKQGRPLSHQEITTRQRRHDRVTLYRTLNTLRAAGLVHAVQGLEGVWRFCAHRPEYSGCPGNHAHFLCLSCGRMICLPDQKLPYVEVPPEMEVKGKQLLVYGLCASCIR